MHELLTIKKIVESAAKAAKEAKIDSVSTLKLRIGKMAGIDPSQLEFLFKTYAKPCSLKETTLEIEELSVDLECQKCKETYTDERFDNHDFAHSISHAPLMYEAPPCPKCKAVSPQIISGQELDLVHLGS